MANSNRINFYDVLCSGVETVNNATLTAPAAPAGTIIHIIQADSTSARIGGDAFASQVFFTARRANGTSAAPTGLVANDQIGGFNFHGYAASGYVGPAATISGFAAGTWSDTSSPAYIDLRTTPAASLTMVTRLRVESDGGITIPNTATGGSQGAGTINVSGGYYVNGVVIPGGSATPQFTRVGIGTPADATNLLTMLGTFTTDNQSILQTITLNNAGVTFTVSKLLITNTASNAASLIADWQVGGTSQFKLSLAGALTVPGAVSATNGTSSNPSYVFASGSTTGMFRSGSGLIGFAIGGTGETMRISATAVQMLSLNLCGTVGTPDVFLTRVAANSMAMANSTNTQTFTVNGPYTDASNFQALAIVGNSINTTTTGTAPGLTSSTPVLNLAQTWNSAGVTFKAILLNATSTASAAASLLMDLQVGGASKFSVNKDGSIIGALSATFTDFVQTAVSYRFTGTGTHSFIGASGGATYNFTTFTGSVNLTPWIMDGNTGNTQVLPTWNAAGTTFTGWLLNVTNTASAAASLVADIQLSTVSQWKLAKTGTITQVGDLVYSTVGKSFTLTSGTGQRAGNATLVGGTITVTNTTVTANSILMLTRKTSGGTIGTAITYTLSAGASFTINSDNILDTSTFSYLLFELI